MALFNMYEGIQEVTCSETIRRTIEKSSMTRYELAKKSGVSESVLSRFMSNSCGMTITTLDKLAPVLGLTLKEDVYDR